MGIVGISSLGQLLLKAKLITEEQLLEAIQIQKREGKRLSDVLLKLDYVSEEDLKKVLSKIYGVPFFIFDSTFDPSATKLIPADAARRYLLIPIACLHGVLHIAMSDPTNTLALDAIKSLTGMKLSVHVATESAITEAIEKCYSQREPSEIAARPRKNGLKGTLKDTSETDDINKVIDSALEDVTSVEEREAEEIPEIDAPLIKLVNNILLNAIRSRASDVHVEPSEDVVRVRYRIDGVLHPVLKLPIKIKNAVTSRIKIMSHLDISERRLPQDGRIKLRLGNDREIDVRVSTLPTLFGEKTVMRLLDKSSLQLDMGKLGFDEKPLQDFLDSIEKPYGMILVTGPTGSGKTTTLYSALSQLNKPGVNIVTAEDPVEYNFFGINQVQIKEEIGLTFAAVLRSVLRQDPDIIMVGEIRDFETAEIAIKSALTGHLVLSTLHTNDAPSAVTRLVNMGIEPFLVSSSVILIAAQRLARKICRHCKQEHPLSETVLAKIGFPVDSAPHDIKTFVGKGCSECNHTGYRGRIALYEVMPLADQLKELVLQGASALDLKREAMKLGMLTLRQSGIAKVMEGVTSVEELLRVTFED